MPLKPCFDVRMQPWMRRHSATQKLGFLPGSDINLEGANRYTCGLVFMPAMSHARVDEYTVFLRGGIAMA
ncbi:MAG: hypothetical protein ABW154_08875 [Dyella sp.]